MSPAVMFWTMFTSSTVMFLAASAHLVIHEISWHDLEEYCNRRRRPESFSKIIDLRDQLALGTLMLQTVCTAISVCCLVFLMLDNSSAIDASSATLWSIVGVAILVMIVINSWVPWAISQAMPAPFLFYTWRLWWIVSGAAWPLLVGADLMSKFFFRARGESPEEDPEEEAFEDEILSLVSEGENDGYLEQDRAEMIEGVMELDDFDVGKVMTPRSRIDGLDFSTGWEDMLEFVVDSGRTRIPIYKDNLDNIIGILYAKDILRESLRSTSKRRPINKLIRDLWIVPESTLLSAMLQQFRERRVHMAIVEDEYGGVAGLVTIEDVLEEIVGEIIDETDDEEMDEITDIDDNTVEVTGMTHIHRLNEHLGLQLPEDEEFDTVSGLLMSELKEVPRVGKEFVFDNVKFNVEQANRRFIEIIRVTVISEDEAGQTND